MAFRLVTMGLERLLKFGGRGFLGILGKARKICFSAK